MKSLFYGLICALCLSACALRTIVQPIDGASTNLTGTTKKQTFRVFELGDTTQFAQATKLGRVKIKDAGLSVGCTYADVLRSAQIAAQDMGGNAMKITAHKTPGIISTCHRIEADVYAIPDLWRYEDKIFWSDDRHLDYRDFKADTVDRPFLAVTSSGFGFSYHALPFRQQQAHFEVRTTFFCRDSYFKMTSDSASTLRHEQVHFDISEIYARRFRQELQEATLSKRTLALQVEKIYNQHLEQLRKEQDRYDAEVYPNPIKLGFWIAKCEKELKELEPWASPEFDVRLW